MILKNSKILLSLFMGIYLFISCVEKTNIDTVKTLDRQLLLNNKPYLIKGVCYHPVPKGSNQRSFKMVDKDLKLMVEAGINTIRVYEPIDNKDVLDKIAALNLKIIIGFGYDQNGIYDIQSGSFINYIKKYKNHKAILMWELGNEYNYHPEWFDGNIKKWYKIMNNTAVEIHKTDTNHPVTTAHGELPSKLALSMCSDIDIWGMNVYRWDKPEIIFNEWERISTKPMYLSETGSDSYMSISKEGYAKGENEEAQANANKKILKSILKNTTICSGVSIFSFIDGWWKAGDNDIHNVGGAAPNSSGVPYDGTANEEYWGMVDINRKKKKTFFEIQEIFSKIKK